MPAYQKYSELEDVGDPAFVRSSLDIVWSGLGGIDLGVLVGSLPSPESVRDLIPEEDDWNEWAPQAEDAVASLVYVLELLRENNIDYAVYAAERAYAAAEEFEARKQGLEVVGVGDGENFLRSSSIQAEIQRQVDALSVVQNAVLESSVIPSLRAAASRLAVGGLT